MSDTLFIALYLIVPLAAYALLRASRIKLLQASIPSVVFGYYLTFAYLGVVAVYFNWTFYEHIDPTDTTGLLRVFLYSATTFLLMTFGFWLASRLKGSIQASQWQPARPARTSVYLPLILMVAVSGLALALYLKNFSTTALSVALEGDSSVESKLIRSQMTNAFEGEGKLHYYTVFFQSLLPFCAFVALGQAVVKKSFLLHLFVAGVLCLALYAAVVGVEKGPAIYLVMGCVLTYVHGVQGRITVRNILTVALAAAALIIPMTLFFMGWEGRTGLDIASWIFSRIFVGNIIPSYFYLNYFPSHHDFLWGRSLPNPRGVFPWESYPLTIEISEFLFGRTELSETVGSAPTAYWGEIYANFGPYAILVAAPLVGIYVYVIHILIEKLSPSPIKSAFVGWCAIHFMNLAVSGISGYLLDTDLILIALTAAILLFANGEIRLTWKKPAALTAAGAKNPG